MSHKVPEYDAETVARFETVPASSLRFGDLLAYFGEHVRSTQEDGPMVKAMFIRKIGGRVSMKFYPNDMVTVLRAGSMRGAV